MAVQHYVVVDGDTWAVIAQKLSPLGATQTQITAFVRALATSNKEGLSTVLTPGRVLHVDEATIPVVTVPPPKPDTVPSQPQNVIAVAGDGKVTLSWLAPADDGGDAIVDYQIFRDGALISDPYNANVSWVDANLTNGVEYSYTIKAVNGVGASVPTAAVKAKPVAPAPTNPEINETFANNSLNFTMLRGTLSIANGQLRAGGSNIEIDAYHNTDLKTANHEVSADIIISSNAITGSWFAINARMATSGLTYYSVETDWSAGGLSLLKVVNGAYTNLGSWTTNWTANTTHNLKLSCIGSTIQVAVDGVTVISVTDTGITNNTRVGVHAFVPSTAYYAWDNFKAKAATVVLPPPTTPPVVTPPVVTPPPTTTGKYYTKNGKLGGPDGKVFVPIGVNGGVSPRGAQGWWNEQGTGLMNGNMPNSTKSKAQAYAEYGFNFARLTCSYDSNSGYTREQFMQGLYDVVDAYTAQGIVCMPAWHGYNQGFDPTLGWIQGQTEYLNWLDTVVTKYKDNPRVWINPLNEPYGNNPAAGWKEAGDWLYNRVRAIAPDMMFCWDLPGWAQTINYAVTNGPAFIAGKKNAFVAFHNYAMGAPTGLVQQAQSLGVPVAIMEYGETLAGGSHNEMVWVSDNAYNLQMGAVAWWGAGNRADTFVLRNKTGSTWYDLDVPLNDFGKRLFALAATKPEMPAL